MPHPDPTPAWLVAARDPAIAAELEAVYEYIAAAVESRGPACWASGRCCNFEATGHLLYTTGLEAAYTIARLPGQEVLSPGVLSPESQGAPSHRLRTPGLRTSGLRTQDLPCPFQSANLCTVHTIKPLGCRVYFCDRSAQAWQQDLSERALTQVRAIHDRHDLDYRYGEWRAILAMFRA